MVKKIPPYLLHILGSALFLSIPVFSSPDFDENINLFTVAPFLRSFASYILLLIFFYANYLYFIPRFYFRGRRRSYFVIVSLSFVLIALLPFLVARFGTIHIPKDMPLPFPRHHHHGPDVRFFLEASGIFHFLLVFSLSFLIRINIRLGDIQNEKLKTEVSYLKAQINPHFLFNTLNSLYSLALIKSEDTPGAILKLSSIMRYVVSESSRETVALDKEIEYVRNYIALQHLRMDENTRFSFEVIGAPAGKAISPLLLIPFIENAFKYGLNPEAESEIAICINIQGNHLEMFVRNKKSAVVITDEEKTEQGIDNTLKRLEYLYKGKYALDVKETDADYQVSLKIDLQ